LHPAFIGPLGVFALTWSALRNGRAALGWTVVFVLAVIPLASVWWVGLNRGWYSDRDLSVRSERPGALLVGVSSAAMLLLLVHVAGAPVQVRDLAITGLIATSVVTLATVAGAKVSGHVAVPVGVFVLLLATSYRGPWPFLLVALAVSWARVREGRHTPSEVLAGWGIAGGSGLVARLFGP
jgi:membrane-associated phospholipid phosphatase